MFSDLKVSYFLAVRYLRRSSLGINLLVVSIMTLTFINLLFTIGILLGLVEGASSAYVKQYSGDVFITKNVDKDYIERTDFVESVLRGFPGVKDIVVRYVGGGTIEANYRKNVSVNETKDIVVAEIVGIDPENELRNMDLEPYVVEGSFINNRDSNGVVLGGSLLEKYSPVSIASFDTLSEVKIGDKVRLSINGNSKEFIVGGILYQKLELVGRRVFMLDNEFIKLAGRNTLNANEIAVISDGTKTDRELEMGLINSGIDKFGLVRIGTDSLGDFFEKLRGTFSILGNVIGGIALIVGAATIFIVIFITVLTRRKYIGIMEAVGISNRTIKYSYVYLSIFYSLVGIILGSLFIIYVLVPFFVSHPIDFPFSDGILYFSWSTLLYRAFIFLAITILAALIPAWMITKKDPLKAILGR